MSEQDSQCSFFSQREYSGQQRKDFIVDYLFYYVLPAQFKLSSKDPLKQAEFEAFEKHLKEDNCEKCKEVNKWVSFFLQRIEGALTKLKMFIG